MHFTGLQLRATKREWKVTLKYWGYYVSTTVVVGRDRVGTAFPHLFRVLLWNCFEAVLKLLFFWMRSHTFFVSTTSLVSTETGICYKWVTMHSSSRSRSSFNLGWYSQMTESGTRRLIGGLLKQTQYCLIA